jgi:hypothetical protein
MWLYLQALRNYRQNVGVPEVLEEVQQVFPLQGVVELAVLTPEQLIYRSVRVNHTYTGWGLAESDLLAMAQMASEPGSGILLCIVQWVDPEVRLQHPILFLLLVE